ncbi:MAG: response regulator [gamma proteobacterium symbiont of Taylorina sp.]|nr:response regulator [gamma proteobacterium symbiont of Taylorina sp.]
MNLNLNPKILLNDITEHIKISLLFFVLVCAIEALILSHWFFILKPAVQIDANANAQIIAESQGRLLAQSLMSKQGILQLNNVDDVIDRSLLLKDPILGEFFFKGVEIELDLDILDENQVEQYLDKNELQFFRGDISCLSCFSIGVGLYAQSSNELFGLASFYVNDAIFQKFISDIKQKIYIEAGIVFFIALFAWFAAIQLIKQLRLQISERKKAELELIHAKEQAEAAYKVKSDFLANSSHELRTPLNAIIGINYLLLKGKLSEKQREYAHKMDRSAHLLLNLINDILDFSKNESGKVVLEKINFNLADVLSNVQKLIDVQAQEKQIKLKFLELKQVPPYLNGDPNRLGQILLNLCSNAVKFTHQGQVCVSVDVVQRLDKSVTLQFSVTDTGIGLDQQQQKKLFQSFSQVDSSTTRQYGGTGLGLVICKQLSELMQGKIWVKSQLNTGSTFSFTAVFAIAQEQNSDENEPTGDTEIPCWAQEKLLLVEDIIINQEIITAILEETRINIDVADNGIEAIKKIQENYYDVVLMDVQMPIMDGIEATKIIRQKEKNKTLPIIALTAHALFKDKEKCLQCGMDDYISKPIIVDDLFSKLKHWLPETQLMIKPQTINQFNDVIENNIAILNNEFTGMDVVEVFSRCNGKIEMLSDLLQKFVRKGEQSLVVLDEFIYGNNWLQAGKSIHTLKGTGGNLCAEDIYDICLQFEKSIKKQDAEQSHQLILQLALALNEINRLITLLHDMTDNHLHSSQTKQHSIDGQIDPVVIKPLIKQLEKLILRNNLQAEQLAEQLKQQIPAGSLQPELQLLCTYLTDLDFDNALLSIQQISLQVSEIEFNSNDNDVNNEK